MKGILCRVRVFLCGLALCLVLLEAGLFVFAGLYRDTGGDGQGGRPGRTVILCMGDSFTYGLGAPEGMDYPSQLGRMFAAARGTDDVIVVNAGVCGDNTRDVLDKLDSSLRRYEPDVFLLLCGSTNGWNFHGLYEYLYGRSWKTAVYSFLSNLRVVRLWRLAAGNIRSRMAAGAVPESAVLEFADRLAHDLDAGRMEACAAALEGQGLDAGPGRDEITDAAGVLAGRMPFYFLLYRTLFYEHLRAGRPGRALDVGFAGLARAPDDRRLFDLMLTCVYTEWARRPEIKRSFARRLKAFEAEDSRGLVRMTLNSLDSLDARGFSRTVKDWYLSDLGKIAAHCRARAVVPVVQGYPKDNLVIEDELRAFSAREKVAFISHWTEFMKIPAAERETCFSPCLHCTAKGYELLARTTMRFLVGRGLVPPPGTKKKPV